MRFTISKSEWVEKLLSRLGYKDFELLDIRIGDRAATQQMPQSIEETKQAQQQFLDADWIVKR